MLKKWRLLDDEVSARGDVFKYRIFRAFKIFRSEIFSTRPNMLFNSRRELWNHNNAETQPEGSIISIFCNEQSWPEIDANCTILHRGEQKASSLIRFLKRTKKTQQTHSLRQTHRCCKQCSQLLTHTRLLHWASLAFQWGDFPLAVRWNH